VAHGEVVEIEELECERPDGSRVFLHASSAPVRDSQGRILAAVMNLHDVTRARHTEEALREEARLIETLHWFGSALTSQLDQTKLVDAITREATRLTNAEFGVFYYSATSEQGETYVKHSSQGIEDDELSHLPSGGITPLLAQTFRASGIVREGDITRDPRFGALERDPQEPTLRSYMAVPVKSASGQAIGGLFFGHSRAGAFGEREERLVAGIAAWAAVAMDNARLYQEAQRALHVRDEVLAVVSHDLRNPLNAISIAAESMRHMELNAQQRERYAAAIRRGIERCNRLISDLLDASKIEGGKLLVEPSRVTVQKLLEQSGRDHAMMADKRGVSLIVQVAEGVPRVMADAARIRQVLDNLIGNALRFTEPGGRVELRAEPVAGGASIIVADTGTGIPEEDLPQLFDRYWQAKQQHRAGAGLGLYIARGIIAAHNSHISVDSKPGVGTTFRFTLPSAE
jgi:signal transduction histidine kinase